MGKHSQRLRTFFRIGYDDFAVLVRPKVMQVSENADHDMALATVGRRNIIYLRLKRLAETDRHCCKTVVEAFCSTVYSFA